MKRILRGAAAALLLVACSGAAHAEVSKVQAGVQMWINQWTQDDHRFGSITSDSTVLFGPAIEVKFPNHVFVDASYLFSLSDYTFSSNAVYNVERQDADIAIGYMIVPVFGVLAGYKDSVFKQNEPGVRQTVYGPLIGMIVIAPMSVDSSFYSKLTYLFTRFKEEGAFGGFQEDSPGWSLEFGFKVGFTREFSGTFGYKYETNTGSNSNIQDSFSGFVFGAMFAF